MTESDDIGVCILAGGQSHRMGGKDKALVELAGSTMLAHILDKIRMQTNGPIILNANGDPARFSNFELPVVEDIVPDFAGPLAGILTGLDWMSRQNPQPRYMLSVPVDTPLVPEYLVATLLDTADTQNLDVVSVVSDGKRHPVIALWSLALLESLRQAVADGARKVESWVNGCNSAYVDWPTAPYDPFLNINTPDDLKVAEVIILQH